LNELWPTLGEMSERFVALRGAVAEGNLAQFLALIAEQEAAAAHVAYLEGQRQRIDGAAELLETAKTQRSGAQGSTSEESDVSRALTAMEGRVTHLRQEQERTLELLGSAIAATRRTRSHLLSLSGTVTTYAGPSGREA
jgi:ATP-dependent exoDNAse (exonuclease V) alpha subunit